jgi:hypothetical protein
MPMTPPDPMPTAPVGQLEAGAVGGSSGPNPASPEPLDGRAGSDVS